LSRICDGGIGKNDKNDKNTEILIKRHHISGVLGHIRSRVHRDPDIGVVQRDRVVDPVAEECHVLTGAARDLDDPRLLIGADPREHRRRRDRRREGVIVERLDLDPSVRPNAPACSRNSRAQTE
jgi:hypothetical protein